MEFINITELEINNIKEKTTDELKQLFLSEYNIYSDTNEFLVKKIEENTIRRNNIALIETELATRNIKVKIKD